MKINLKCNLAALLMKERKSQVWLAKEIGARKNHVNDWCRGVIVPHAGYLLRIQKVTGWTPEEIFEEVEMDKMKEERNEHK